MYRVAVVGATGLVGSTMLKILDERDFPISEIFAVASQKSEGKKIIFKNEEVKVITIPQAIDKKPHIALFSAGGNVSLQFAPLFAEAGTTVIDNSSAWRMDNSKKLVVPEVNANVLTSSDKIIANPNCSTIQMVVALKPLHDKYKIKRVVVSTYQSVTGTGIKGVNQLMNERNGISGEMAYKYKIDLNVIPQIDVFLPNSYTKEEMKMVNETIKIMGDENIKVTSTTVRIPVMGGHSEAVNVEFENEFEIDEIFNLLKNFKGITVLDNTSESIYPMPLIVEGKDDVFVGRIRRDESQPKTLNMWVVSDNLRKGAATNAVQIAEYLASNNLI
ncbi:MAG: aspartate-semialdehyde dehydrogenase [Bacteroidetes bacterium]|nr:aspartate-semialdehyde dehydrogenase [Bacteroidota bacterium]